MSSVPTQNKMPMSEAELIKIHKETKKAEAKQAKQTKKELALNPDVSAGLSVESKPYFLGWTLVPLLLPHFGGQGPSLVPGPMQRELTKAGVNAIVQMGASGLMREDVQHALTYCVDPRYVDHTTLSRDPQGPFSLVQWGPGAPMATIEELGGQHRKAALEFFYKESLQKLASLERKKKNASVERDIEQLRRELQEQGTWLVAIYSNKLYDNKLDNQLILLHLSNNSSLRSLPDSPAHQLNNFLQAINGSTSAEGLDKVITYGQTLTGDIRTLLQRCWDEMELMAKLHKYKAFQSTSLLPKQLLELKKTNFGIFSRIIEHSLGVVSDLCMPSAKKHKTSFFIANQVMEIFSSGFTQFLDDQMDYFGHSESKQWNEAWDQYRTFVMDSSAQLVKEQLEQEDEYSSEQIQIWGGLVSGLDQTFNTSDQEYPFCPFPLPFLCPEFVQALYKQLLAMTDGISLICHWIMPGLSDLKNQRASKAGSSMMSDTEAAFQHLQYFHHQETPGVDWAHLEPLEVGNYSPSPDSQPAHVFLEMTCFQIIKLIFEHRTTVLVPLGSKIHQALVYKDKKDMDKTMKDVLVGYMEQWADTSFSRLKEWGKAHKRKFKKPESQLRHLQKSTIQLNSSSEMVKTLAKVLEKTSFNWFVTPTNTNKASLHQRLTLALWNQVQANEDQIIPLVTQNPHLFTLRDMLFTTIKETPGLEFFQPWFTIPAPPQLLPLVHFEDQLVEEVASNLEEEAHLRELKSVLDNVAKALKTNPKTSFSVEGPNKRLVLPQFQGFRVIRNGQ